MTSMQNFISWLKAKSKKAKLQEEQGAPLGAGDEAGLGRRTSLCRSSMKLPPIPRGEWDPAGSRRPSVPVMGVACLRTDSPAHIYEEIPHHLVGPDPGGPPPDDDHPDLNVTNVTNLDFGQAKEVGSFLVVPIRSRVKSGNRCLTQIETNNNAGDLPSACDSSPLRCGGPALEDDAGSCTYPGGGGSSGDSAVADLSHDHHSDFLSPHHAHCGRCRRPHGIFNGVTLSHFGDAPDPESVELQTYFNRQMLREEEEDHGPVVERFLLVPSVPPDLEAPEGGDPRTVVSPDPTDRGRTEPQLQGSDSNDTCTEYDLRSSDQSSSSQSRPDSLAFDSGSSLYAFSQSERGMGRCGRGQAAPGTRPRPQQESDSSNDTFSEYDLEKSPEYEYYLSKVQHNLWFKSDVMRVIRESESSEYETTSDVPCPCRRRPQQQAPGDDSSLTTVTSLSDLSLSDREADPPGGSRSAPNTPRQPAPCHCQHQHPKPTRHKTKTKTRHSGRARSERRHTKDVPAAPPGGDPAAGDVPAWKRADRRGAASHAKHSSKRRSSSRKTVELYCLPDFSEGGSPGGGVVDDPERLSVRATDFTPPAPAASPRHHQAAPRTKLPPDAPSGSHPRRAPQQNRMLTDLMKMNHDRLLVLF